MNKQQLAQKIWASANQMRSKIEANEYKDYILRFIFYKYLSDKEVKFLKENDYDDELLKTVSEEDDETVKWVQENIGYFIAYKDLFSTWLSMGKDFDVSNVRDALSAFSRLISNTHKKVFDKVFDTLQTGLSKLGDSSGSQTKAISGLLTLIKDQGFESYVRLCSAGYEEISAVIPYSLSKEFLNKANNEDPENIFVFSLPDPANGAMCLRRPYEESVADGSTDIFISISSDENAVLICMNKSLIPVRDVYAKIKALRFN